MRTIGTLLLALILACNIAIAQDTMYVHQNEGVITKIAVSKIDSVIFYNAATLGTVSDIDGNVYHTVKIGTQVWMVENLKTTKYRNGNPIPNVTDYTQWSNLTTGAQCKYNNDAAIGIKYGKLYNWYAVNDNRNIAPIGWHVPTDAEWTILQNYVSANYGTSGSAAKALASKTDWVTNYDAGAVGNDLTRNNASGFTALPGGSVLESGQYRNAGLQGYWWSSTVYIADDAYGRYMGNDSRAEGVKKVGASMGSGFSVRCVKD